MRKQNLKKFHSLLCFEFPFHIDLSDSGIAAVTTVKLGSNFSYFLRSSAIRTRWFCKILRTNFFFSPYTFTDYVENYNNNNNNKNKKRIYSHELTERFSGTFSLSVRHTSVTLDEPLLTDRRPPSASVYPRGLDHPSPPQQSFAHPSTDPLPSISSTNVI